MSHRGWCWVLVLIVSFQLLQSCHPERKLKSLVYFNEPGDTILSKVVQRVEPIVQPGDRLSIVVGALNPLSAAPYNLASTTPGSTSGSAGGYLVEADGTIQFPQLGKLQVSTMKRKQLVDFLTKMLVKYVNDPIVTIEFLNFKITVLGEVNHQGTFNIPEGKVTVLDAIGLAGDLPFTARRDNITVIREKNGNREFGKINVLSKNAFSSPYYVLQQNDVVYVEPTKDKVAASDQSFIRNFSIATSVFSVFTTVVVLVINTIKK
ncbi:polysaccharide biosynthesis/export family protein [Segetibacter sp.]|jgi:polysaccharide export outer membrane protein|uniref:polysaccharide biosynthesis/export family protein n=1 Tax=Segetibacter sp. TaxID=2231182 RepID=UPI002617CB52|nr:polysaccharide biosynthesis/export family protein [Segetibacter sp.]MCW3079623.1 Soluble ligand binding domain protein [Segetibacter sp.]